MGPCGTLSCTYVENHESEFEADEVSSANISDLGLPGWSERNIKAKPLIGHVSCISRIPRLARFLCHVEFTLRSDILKVPNATDRCRFLGLPVACLLVNDGVLCEGCLWASEDMLGGPEQLIGVECMCSNSYC